MLFNQQTLDQIARGAVTTAFRKWRRPTVKSGGRLRTTVGELAIDLVTPTSPEDITHAQARAAGFADRAEAVASLPLGEGPLYRIEFRLARADPRKALADDAELDAETVSSIRSALENLDRRSRSGGWTVSCLRLLRESPGVAAADLAGIVGIEKALFKRRLRQLKELGLTHSLDIGYRLSPRGKRFLALLTATKGSAGRHRGDDEKPIIRDSQSD